jgi:hypothetical protein
MLHALALAAAVWRLHLEQFRAELQVLKPRSSVVDGVVYRLGRDLGVRGLLQALCQPQGQVRLICCLIHL